MQHIRSPMQRRLGVVVLPIHHLPHCYSQCGRQIQDQEPRRGRFLPGLGLHLLSQVIIENLCKNPRSMAIHGP